MDVKQEKAFRELVAEFNKARRRFGLMLVAFVCTVIVFGIVTFFFVRNHLHPAP